MVKVRRLTVWAVLSSILLLAVVQLAFSYVEVGITQDFWVEGLSATAYDFSDVPQTVVNDATRLAAELFGNNQEKYRSFINQLLGTYEEAQGKDFLVVFNAGGWGWKTPQRVEGWGSILDGIQTELNQLGYQSAAINYQRTSESLAGCFKELLEVLDAYPFKARDLASRVEFLTVHLPKLKVIVTGESNGTVIADRVMSTLRDNQSVYSIQTGTPFWHRNVMYERTLVMNSNGTGPDSFNRGDVPTILWASLKSSLGLEKTTGTVLHFLSAPGHDYSWQYPEVYQQIIKFLDNNFGMKRG